MPSFLCLLWPHAYEGWRIDKLNGLCVNQFYYQAWPWPGWSKPNYDILFLWTIQQVYGILTFNQIYCSHNAKQQKYINHNNANHNKKQKCIFCPKSRYLISIWAACKGCMAVLSVCRASVQAMETRRCRPAGLFPIHTHPCSPWFILELRNVILGHVRKSLLMTWRFPPLHFRLKHWDASIWAPCWFRLCLSACCSGFPTTRVSWRPLSNWVFGRKQ